VKVDLDKIKWIKTSKNGLKSSKVNLKQLTMHLKQVKVDFKQVKGIQSKNGFKVKMDSK
jgi:hypothetical protein